MFETDTAIKTVRIALSVPVTGDPEGYFETVPDGFRKVGHLKDGHQGTWNHVVRSLRKAEKPIERLYASGMWQTLAACLIQDLRVDISEGKYGFCVDQKSNLYMTENPPEDNPNILIITL